MEKRLYTNALLVDPVQKMEMPGSLLTLEGKIAWLGQERPFAEGDWIEEDCRGLVLAPGLVDPHVHLRDPGQTHKETLETGAQAAAAGGFTAVIAMANTEPALDRPDRLEDVIQRSRGLDCRIYPAAAVTVGLEGRELTDMEALAEAGAVTFTDDGKTVGDHGLFLQAMERAAALGVPVSVHCEAPGLEGDRSMNRGAVSQRLGLQGALALAEELMIQRDLMLAQQAGAHVHVQHLTTARGVALVAQAKAQGVQVTAEATPHHMALTEEAVLEWGTDAKMNPPLRTEADRQAVGKALMEGVLDMVATDHAPHSPQEKALSMAQAPNGIIGLETAFSACYTELCLGQNFPLIDLIQRMSSAPCQAFGLPGGSLKVGSAADLVLIDPQGTWRPDPAKFRSKSRNCPFCRDLRGVVVRTVMAGRTTFQREGR